jgi:hypothetical protein
MSNVVQLPAPKKVDTADDAMRQHLRAMQTLMIEFVNWDYDFSEQRDIQAYLAAADDFVLAHQKLRQFGPWQ